MGINDSQAYFAHASIDLNKRKARCMRPGRRESRRKRRKKTLRLAAEICSQILLFFYKRCLELIDSLVISVRKRVGVDGRWGVAGGDDADRAAGVIVRVVVVSVTVVVMAVVTG